MSRDARFLPAALSAIARSLAASWMVGIMLFERFGRESTSPLGERLNELVFIDFFASFLIALLVPVRNRAHPWREWSRIEKGLSLLGGGLVMIVGTWLLHGLGGWILTLPWLVGIAAGWHDTATLSQQAWARVGWALASAFLIALLFSILGVDAEVALRSDPRGTLAWGLLYFGGIALAEVAVTWQKVRTGNPEAGTSR